MTLPEHRATVARSAIRPSGKKTYNHPARWTPRNNHLLTGNRATSIDAFSRKGSRLSEHPLFLFRMGVFLRAAAYLSLTAALAGMRV